MFMFQIVSLLISAGADVNVEEEFQNVYTTAREKRKHSLEVQIAREDEFCARLSPMMPVPLPSSNTDFPSNRPRF